MSKIVWGEHEPNDTSFNRNLKIGVNVKYFLFVFDAATNLVVSGKFFQAYLLFAGEDKVRSPLGKT